MEHPVHLVQVVVVPRGSLVAVQVAHQGAHRQVGQCPLHVQHLVEISTVVQNVQEMDQRRVVRGRFVGFERAKQARHLVGQRFGVQRSGGCIHDQVTPSAGGLVQVSIRPGEVSFQEEVVHLFYGQVQSPGLAVDGEEDVFAFRCGNPSGIEDLVGEDFAHGRCVGEAVVEVDLLPSSQCLIRQVVVEIHLEAVAVGLAGGHGEKRGISLGAESHVGHRDAVVGHRGGVVFLRHGVGKDGFPVFWCQREFHRNHRGGGLGIRCENLAFNFLRAGTWDLLFFHRLCSQLVGLPGCGCSRLVAHVALLVHDSAKAHAIGNFPFFPVHGLHDVSLEQEGERIVAANLERNPAAIFLPRSEHQQVPGCQRLLSQGFGNSSDLVIDQEKAFEFQDFSPFFAQNEQFNPVWASIRVLCHDLVDYQPRPPGLPGETAERENQQCHHAHDQYQVCLFHFLASFILLMKCNHRCTVSGWRCPPLGERTFPMPVVPQGLSAAAQRSSPSFRRKPCWT